MALHYAGPFLCLKLINCYFHSMLYRLLKIAARLALPLFTKRIVISNAHALQNKGPLLLAVNHPNSFFDALVLGAYMQQPVYFLSRGDVFKNKNIRRLLGILKMIPIYRIRDGKDMLSLNEETFVKSVEVLRNNGVLLIFVEGFCAYQTTLQLPLKKGAPRILQTCWQQGNNAKVLPVWLQYSSFNQLGNTIHIRLGEVFGKEIIGDVHAATCLARINEETGKQLLHLQSSMPFENSPATTLQKILLFFPAMLGAVLHAPFYLPVQSLCRKKCEGTVFYQSVLFSILLIGYPLLLLAGAAILFSFTGLWWSWPLVMLGLPALAWCYIQWK